MSELMTSSVVTDADVQESAERVAGLRAAADLDPVDPHRAQVIAGLRELAQFLADHPEVPVYRYNVDAGFSAAGGDDAAIGLVRQMAESLGVEVDHHGAYWTAERLFGRVRYGCSYVEDARMAQYHAAHSYTGAVEPDGSRP